MKGETTALIEKISKLEKRLHEVERILSLIEKKIEEQDIHYQQKNKGIQDLQDHLIIPHIQIFG